MHLPIFPHSRLISTTRLLGTLEYAKNENPSEVNFDISKWISSGPGTFGLVYPKLRPGELRPDNSGRLIQARPNSGPAIPIQAGPNSGPSHLRPAYPNSGLSQFRPVPFQAGLCHFRPVPFQAGPTQAGANSGRCQLRPSCPISGPFQFRFIPSQAGANSGQSQLRPSCPNSGRCQFRPIPTQAELSQLRPGPFQADPISGQHIQIELYLCYLNIAHLT